MGPGLFNGRPQVFKVGNNISTLLTLNTEAYEWCMLSPLLYSLFTHDFVVMHELNNQVCR